MKTILKISLLTIISSFFCFISCRDEKTSNDGLKTTNSLSKNLFAKSNNQNLGEFIWGSKTYMVLPDKSADYYENQVFKYNLSIFDKNIIVKDESDTEGKVTVTNSTTNENFIVSNLRTFDDHVLFDVLTSTGVRYDDMQYNYGTNGRVCAWCPIVEVIVNVTSVIIDIYNSSSSGSGLSQCTQALNSLHCPNGTRPYMNYSEGNWWSNPSCNVGCAK